MSNISNSKMNSADIIFVGDIITVDDSNPTVEALNYNLERAIFSLDPELLDKLIGWDKRSILKAKKRLIDLNFLWAANFEKIIPIAHHRQSRKDPESFIRIIQESREI